MGSVCHCFKKENWSILREGKHIHSDNIIYEVEVGEWNDYYASGYLSIWMVKSVYDKIMQGEYIVKNQAYQETPILILNKDSLIINPLTDELDKINKCWRDKGCPFNSNTSFKYMKCWQDSYSVEQCRIDNEQNFLQNK